MKFKIEQVAICPKNTAEAMKLLMDLGLNEWVYDHVTATGNVYGQAGGNEADQAFNYTAIDGKEFEVLHYTTGPNWMEDLTRVNSVSHLGMHCTAEELVQWRKFFEDGNIPIAQEVMTQKHTNPYIAGKRWYNYVIFDTRELLGVDLKFIVRRDSQ